MRRRNLLTQLLDSGEPRTQEEIAAALSQAGEHVTQATVSRDLAALGAIRGADGYRLINHAGDGRSMSDDLALLISDHAFRIQLANSIVVIQTSPGHAQLLAVGFDRNPLRGVVGCIAGDDTIFLATESPKAAKQLQTELNALAGMGAS